MIDTVTVALVMLGIGFFLAQLVVLIPHLSAERRAVGETARRAKGVLPAVDEDELLHVHPREWVLQAERAVEAEQPPTPAPHAHIAPLAADRIITQGRGPLLSSLQSNCRHAVVIDGTCACGGLSRVCANCGFHLDPQHGWECP